MADITASITSTLTIKHLQGAVHGVSDLATVRVGAIAGTSTEDTFSRLRISYRKFATLQDGLDALRERKLDAFVYPTWSYPPRLIGDLNTPGGDNSQVFSPTTGWPAINVPMGYTRGTLPVGMTFFGRAWSEASLFKFAFAYEQATRHRHPPASVPPLR